MPPLARPLAFLATLLVTAPAAAADRPLRAVIDAEVQAGWKRQKLTAPGPAQDSTFLRRAYLDLVGTVPTAEEARRFLQDRDAKKREKLLDRLLADPRFASAQADVWDLALFGRNPPNGDATRRRDGFKKWLTGKFAKNEPFDRWARALVMAEEDGSELFLVQFRNQPEEATVAVSRLFLGTQLQCARCHDHPFEKLTQRDFYGMAGFFVRLVVVEEGSGVKRRFRIGEKRTGEVLFSGDAKDQRPGRRGNPVRPKFLGGAELEEPAVARGFKEPVVRGKLPPKPDFSRKEKLAAWLTDARNPYFARAAANRLWAQFMGRGIVHPVDDLGGKAPPGHPELLDALTKALIDSKFDLRAFIGEIVRSKAYQIDCKGENTDALPRWYDRARVRPLSAEELVASLRTVTGFGAGPLPSAMEEYVRRSFGEPTNGQGEFQSSLGEHLFLNNAYHVRQMIARKKGNLADALLDARKSADERIDHLYLATLARFPTAKEKEIIKKHLAGPGRPEVLMQEAIWALLASSEFRFNR